MAIGCGSEGPSGSRGRGNHRGSGLAFGIPIGVGLGVALGLALDNLALGIAMGAAIGVSIGFAIDQGRGDVGLGDYGEPRGRLLLAVVVGVLLLLAGAATLVFRVLK
jgi:hypothetical protein